MNDFIDRRVELAALNRLTSEPGAQFVMVYGRRRVGKTTLLTHWAGQTALPTFYWVAKRDNRATLMANLAQHIWAWEHGLDRADVELRPADWEATLSMLARVAGERRCVVILDELPYLLESDPGFASYLQAAWDHHFKTSQIRLLVSGSHVGMMTRLLEYQAPLYGRFTSQLSLQPLAFPDIAGFLPGYDVHRRLAVYAVLGGIPAYLERWQPRQSIAANIERLFLQRTGWFRNEPLVLVSDLTQRETESYEAILRAIAAGHHTRDKIAEMSVIPSTSLSHYLPRLIDLGLVERRVPATVPPTRRTSSRDSRYFLHDPYLRFYYRFVEPNLHLIEQGLSRRLWTGIESQFRAFVADTFEGLCRTWVLAQAQRGTLPFEPEVVGSFWAPNVQVDVVAVNWPAKQILLGEAKWGEGRLGREVIRGLVDKTPLVVPEGGTGWQVHYAFFAREGFTPAAQIEARTLSARALTLAEMEPDLQAI